MPVALEGFTILLVVVYGRSLQSEAIQLALECPKLRIQPFSKELALQEFLAKNAPNALVADESGRRLISSHTDLPRAVIHDPATLKRTIYELLFSRPRRAA